MMPDPFEALRTAHTPIDPDPAFAARLRARVVRALHPERGEQTMILQSSETAEQLRQGDISYVALWVHDVDTAARFYASVLGWRYGSENRPYNLLVEGQSLSMGIAQLDGGLAFQRQLGLPVPEVGVPTAYVVFAVNHLEAALTSVRANGGSADEPKQAPWGRVGACADNQGLLFSLQELPAGMPRPPASGGRHGDVAYLVFETPDATRARAFFHAVLGLQFTQGRGADGWNVQDIVPMSGLSGGLERSSIVPMYRVDDIAAAVQRVRQAGGNATDPVSHPYGTSADCTDDQGTRFLLGQF
jgi:uncharacterized protein